MINIADKYINVANITYVGIGTMTLFVHFVSGEFLVFKTEDKVTFKRWLNLLAHD